MLRAELLMLFISCSCATQTSLAGKHPSVVVCIVDKEAGGYQCSRRSSADSGTVESWFISFEKAGNYFCMPPESLDEILR